MARISKFDRVLESIETLSLEEQEALIDLVQRRLAEKRRDEIAANIAQARVEYQSGQVFRGTVAEIMDELSK
jgi:hypothetical protein